MTRQEFNVEDYWKVVVCYDADYSFSEHLYRELRAIGFPTGEIKQVFRELSKEETLAVTCSNGARHSSVVIFKKHDSEDEYMNSIIHEAEHLKQAMLDTYMIEDKGEPPAYTIGYLAMKMWKVSKHFLCI